MAATVMNVSPDSYRVITLFRNGQELSIAHLFVRHFILSHRLGHLEDDAQWCVGELVGNVVKHTRCTRFKLYMWPLRGGPVFGVWDDHGHIPPIPTREDPFPPFDAESGRGLRSIREIALDLGAYPYPPEGDNGKIIWFQLDAHADQTRKG